MIESLTTIDTLVLFEVTHFAAWTISVEPQISAVLIVLMLS